MPVISRNGQRSRKIVEYLLSASAIGFSAAKATEPEVSEMTTPYSCAALATVSAAGDSLSLERSRLAGSRNI